LQMDSECEQGVHSQGDWIIDREASAQENGLKHSVCEICGKIVAISELGSTFVVREITFGDGISFESAEEICEAGDLSNAPLTFEASFVLPKSYSQRAGVLIGNYDGSSGEQINIEIYSNGLPRLYFKKDNIAYTYLFKTDVRSEDITHLALVAQGTDVSLYVNGVHKETITIDTQLPDAKNNFRVGGDNRIDNVQYFKGTIHAVNIFSEARTEQEVKLDTVLVRGNAKGLVYSNYFSTEQ